jgi:hypothetical protein
MRRTLGFALCSVAAFACHKDTGGDDDGTMVDAPGTASEQPAFTVQSDDITINPGQEITYCWYFHTPNNAAVNIHKFASTMTTGSHHMIMFWGTANQPADGTFDANNCGGISSTSVPAWVYSAQNSPSEVNLPTNDGTGKPLAQIVAAHAPAYFQMHYLNSSDSPIQAHVRLDAYALADGTAFTPTAAYVTYNGNINIPAGATDYPVSQTCNTVAGAKYWSMSTHVHKHAVKTEVLDGATSVFASTDWEHPGAKRWDPDFYTFSSGKLTYTCTYTNTTGSPIVDGASAQTNEMCMASGYIFPATDAKFCYNNLGPF